MPSMFKEGRGPEFQNEAVVLLCISKALKEKKRNLAFRFSLAFKTN